MKGDGKALMGAVKDMGGAPLKLMNPHPFKKKRPQQLGTPPVMNPAKMIGASTSTTRVGY